MIQIGGLDRLWHQTVGNPSSRFEILSYHAGGVDARDLTNYFLASRRDNAMFARCQRLLLALWNADGGKTSTDGMCDSPLLKGLPLMGGSSTIQEDGRTIGAEETSKLLTDYIIQGQVMTMVMSLVDEEDGWDGPTCVAEHLYGIEYMVGSQLINEFTNWDGQLAFKLMSLHLPKPGEAESAEQRQVRTIVASCLQRSFGFKLAHGLILRVFGHTLGSLWRQHPGSDAVPRTYAAWLRHGTVYWDQDGLPPGVEYRVIAPVKRGPLLREA